MLAHGALPMEFGLSSPNGREALRGLRDEGFLELVSRGSSLITAVERGAPDAAFKEQKL